MNDPFLTPKTLNKSILDHSDYVSYNITYQGGHCGYPNFFKKTYWSEAFTVNFFKRGNSFIKYDRSLCLQTITGSRKYFKAAFKDEFIPRFNAAPTQKHPSLASTV